MYDTDVVQLMCETIDDAESDLSPAICSLYSWNTGKYNHFEEFKFGNCYKEYLTDDRVIFYT
jgi:hypothetical protein